MSDIDPFENELNLLWSVPVIWQIDGKGHYMHLAYGLDESAEFAGKILPGATFCVYRRQDEDTFRRFDQEPEWGRFGLGLPTDLWTRWTTGRDSGLDSFLCDVAVVHGFLRDAAGTDNMAVEIPRGDAEDILAKLEKTEAAGRSADLAGKPDPEDGDWHALGSVTIDTGTLLLIDPIHGDADVGQLDESDHAQVSIPGGDFSAVLVGTGMGDGRYPVEGRFTECLFGRRIAEIRVRFLGDVGDYLGGDGEKP